MKRFRQAFFLMQAAEEKAAKQLANRRGIERREPEKLPFGSPDAVGNDGVAMRIEVFPIGTEGLYRHHAARPKVFAVKQRLEGPAHGLISDSSHSATRLPNRPNSTRFLGMELPRVCNDGAGQRSFICGNASSA